MISYSLVQVFGSKKGCTQDYASVYDFSMDGLFSCLLWILKFLDGIVIYSNYILLAIISLIGMRGWNT